MPQTVLSVVLEVVPESAGRLSEIIEEIKKEEETLGPHNPQPYSRLKSSVPTLHFMSMSVFHDSHYDPVFVIEANFDGPPGPFWGQLEAVYERHLRRMLRCCKRPSDRSGEQLYDAVTEPDSRSPIAPYLESRTLTPSAFHQGNRGLLRDRILREAELFTETRSALAQSSPTAPNPYRAMPADQIHQNLRAAMLKKFPWLANPEPSRIPKLEYATDWLRLYVYLLCVVVALSLPGYLFVAVLKALGLQNQDLLAILIVSVISGLVLYGKRRARRGEAAPTRSGGLALSLKNAFDSPANPITLGALALVILTVMVVTLAVMAAAIKSTIDIFAPHAITTTLQGIASFELHRSFWSAFCSNWLPSIWVILVGLGTAAAFSIPVIFVWLRWLERRDSHHDAPPVDQRELRKMTRREDWIPQNHMGSVVLVKPGMLRAALFRIGHIGLGLLVRVIATDGYLGSMRTIHFAHWAFINNGNRLMFFSNFDNSWDNYLDDFIEKAHGGLTLAWSSCTGFPPTRFLVFDGASHGRQFKAWARHSMAVSRFWFSAYRDLTVNQIERNNRIADGLRQVTLGKKEAAAWARDL